PRLDVNPLSDGKLRARVLDVPAESERIARDRPGIHDRPRVRAQRVCVSPIGLVDRQRDLELLAGPGGKRQKFPELVRLHAKRPALARPPAVRSSPAADCRKPCVALTRGARPFVEHDRLAYRAPRDVTAGNGALRRADVLADAEIEMMIAQPFVGE